MSQFCKNHTFIPSSGPEAGWVALIDDAQSVHILSSKVGARHFVLRLKKKKKKPNTFESVMEATQESSNKVKDHFVWVCTMGSLR